jgi:hypothetical protein
VSQRRANTPMFGYKGGTWFATAMNRGTPPHQWEFKSRFRRHAFGWRSQPAIQRINQAVSEIKKIARRDPLLAGEGAVLLLERVSPALENVDSSSGAIGTAVNSALSDLIPIIAEAPAEGGTRAAWLERLWAAHEADQMPYIERLADHWGELCASKELATGWADRLIGITRLALSPDKSVRGYFHGTSACLSALYTAERYQEIIDLLGGDEIWPYKRWAARALAAMGKKSEAMRYAESCRGPWTNDNDVNRLCEETLMSSGLVDEAYQRYGLVANRAGTSLGTFRAVARKYPNKSRREVLHDLIRTTPGEEGKWFAAAKEEGFYDEALAVARSSPCDPRTLARAARDLAARQPDFAVEAGLLAMEALVQGYGYDVTTADVWLAYSSTIQAAQSRGNSAEVGDRMRQIVAAEAPGGFVTRTLGRDLGM